MLKIEFSRHLVKGVWQYMIQQFNSEHIRTTFDDIRSELFFYDICVFFFISIILLCLF